MRSGTGRIFRSVEPRTTYNLARMNMLLHGRKDTEFEIFHGDTLTNECDTLRELNPAKKPSFDAIVANPPLMNAPAFTFRAACRQSVCLVGREEVCARLSPLRSGWLRLAQLPLGTHRRDGR